MNRLLILLALLCAAFPSPAAPKPNIVLIFIDDMGYGDIGPFGSTVNRTPHLDRMAREGMKLTSFYAAPVCSVSRAQVITGCYGARVSIPGVFGPGGRHGINAEEHTVAELLKAQGYATQCIGKWHLGDQPEFLPTRHGFDHYFGIPYSNDMNRKSAEDGRSVVPLVRDDKVIELVDGEGQDSLTERYTDEAVKFIRENKARPFFLYLPQTGVHVPIHPGAKFRGKSANGHFGDWVEELDWSTGRVLDTLRELKLATNTLVIFSTDNGPWLIKGKDAGTAGPLRSGKGTTWEGGVRVPTLAWWPGRIAPGGVCDAVAGNIDFLPTFVSLAGGTVPTDRKIDGRDFSPLLFGKSKESQREAHYYFRGYNLDAVRSGPWKLALGPQSGITAKGERLYNLDADIGEQTDVAGRHPDVVKRLAALATAMKSDIGDGQPGVRPPGRVENPAMLYRASEPSPRTASPATTASLKALKMGDVVESNAAPHVANQPFRITCTVAPQGDGVIVAHGGSAIGYALIIQSGKPAFVIRSSGTITTITASEVSTGPLNLEARLNADKTMTLAINGKTVAQGEAKSLLVRQPAENFSVGFDDGLPVGNYDGKTRFKGTIENLKITVGAN